MTTSGIYILEWPSDKFYIGKSDNIERRWKEHANSFVKGKHAKAMQNAYLNEGPPKYSILEEIHADHIDIYEGMFIAKYIDSPNCLNATKGKSVPHDDWEPLTAYKSILTQSTADHIRHMVVANKQLEDTEHDLNNANNKLLELEEKGIVLPKDELDTKNYILAKIQEQSELILRANKAIDRLSTQIHKLKTRNLWQRIFNIIP
jgi:hypothetical protein